MTRGQRIAVWSAVAAGSILLLVGLALVVLTRTDWGREQVRAFAEEQLRGALDGEVAIVGLEGNLLTRLRLLDVSITDREGRPFLAADTVATGYSLRSLLRRRIVLTDTELVNARVLLDQPPGERWNYARILPEPDPQPTPAGWGDWVRFENVVIVNARVTVRSEWKPDPSLSPAERERKVAEALDPDRERANIQRVPGGFQNIMEFRNVDARLSDVLLADPDVDRTELNVAILRAIAQPYRPPVAEVRALEGRFYISEDSVWFQDVRARLPGSRVAGQGVYHLETADLVLRLVGAPAAFDDLRWLYPAFPEEGGGDLRLTVHSRQVGTRLEAEDMDVRVRESELTGDLRMVLGDTFRILPTDLRFARLESRLVARMIPGFELPRHGTLDGRVSLDGVPESMRVDGDVVFTAEDAGRSRVIADGVVGMDEEVQFSNLRLDLRPLQTDLLRDQVPRLPPGAAITGHAALDGTLGGPLRLNADLALDDPVTGLSRVLAAGLVDPLPDAVRFSDFRLHLRPLQAGLLQPELPELPAGATVSGTVALDGSSAGILGVNGDLVVTDPTTGESRVVTSGGLDLRGELGFVGLNLHFDPLHLPLLRGADLDLPVGGTLTGTARLDGFPARSLSVRGDLEHVEAGERSRVAGSAEILPGDQARVDVRLLPLSLVTAGRFVPEAGLRGEARGTVQAAGDLSDLSVRADLTIPGGGDVLAVGALDLASDRPGYALDTRFQAFDVSAVTARAPAATSLTGTLDATGRGVDPATMRAEIRADLVSPVMNGVAADEVRIRAGIADGLARVDSSMVRLGPAEAWADGRFGLVAGRDGELRYRIEIDSLHALAPYVEVADTGVAEPRPRVRQRALTEARAAVEQEERRRLVAQLATGRERPPEPVEVDTLALEGVPRDSLAGRLEAEGVLRGNVASFDLEGSARAEELVLSGQNVGAGRAEFSWLQRGRDEPTIEFDGEAERLVIEGFALDSARAEVRHAGDRHGSGRATLVAYQDGDTDYRADLEFTLGLDRNELVFHDMDLRFDTLTWSATRPAVVSWNGAGIEVESIELTSDAGGRILVDGRVPVDGQADLELILEEVQLANLAILLQDDAQVQGRVSVHARMEGSLASPRFEGEVSLADGQRNGQELPDIQATFAYANAELATDAELFRDGVVFAVAESVFPIDLALADREGRRLLDGPLVIDIRADSLPVDALPALTEEVRDARGVIAGDVAVRGTWDAPVLEGALTLDLASFRLNGTGVHYQDVAGAIRLDGTTVVVDSLVARAGGPIRVTGQIDVSTLTEPGFDLEVQAQNAWAMRTEDLELRMDADLQVSGPFDRVVVSGDARTHSAVIYLPEAHDKNVVALDDPGLVEALEARLRERFEELVDPPSPLLANLEVEVDLVIAPDTWVRSSDMNVEIYTPEDAGPLVVRLDQRAGRLTLEGTVNSDRGDYSFMSRRFRVTRGAATFVGGSEIDPLLQIVAEHEVQLPGRETIAIRVIIGGTALDPTLALESDARPPISTTDLFTYVALGRSSGSLLQQQGSTLGGQGSATGDLVGNVAGLMTQQMTAIAAGTMLDEFESEMAREFGLDVLHIAPADLPSELFSGRFGDLLRGTQIEAGRYIGPRFFALVRARPTTETRPGATLEYWTPAGFRFTTSVEPRYMAPEPTLRGFDPTRTSVFGGFIRREWRF